RPVSYQRRGRPKGGSEALRGSARGGGGSDRPASATMTCVQRGSRDEVVRLGQQGEPGTSTPHAQKAEFRLPSAKKAQTAGSGRSFRPSFSILLCALITALRQMGEGTRRFSTAPKGIHR